MSSHPPVPALPATSARFLAIETLCRLHKTRTPVNGIYNRLLTEYHLQEKDRQLASNIIYGVLRKRQCLDTILQKLCAKPLQKLKPFVYQALSVGLYQIMFLDRIPESAAVNESVKALKAARLPKQLQGFVNGVLRNSIRQRDELLSLITHPAKPILNHPKWQTDRWQKRFGMAETLRICNHNNEPPTLILQINSCMTERDIQHTLFAAKGIVAEKGSYSETALLLTDYHGGITALPGFADGLFQVQDQGAQLLAGLLGPIVREGEYLDACAGVGGKTSSLIQLCDPLRAKVTAVEPDKERLQRFNRNMKRLHQQRTIPIYSETLQEFAKDCTTRFHGILLDAPCSGTGVIGRHPDIRWNRRVADLQRYQQTQLELLQTASRILHPDGVLVYATCSLEEEENEEVIAQFLATNLDFGVDSCKPFLNKNSVKLLRNGYFAPLPEKETDGFFGARLLRKK